MAGYQVTPEQRIPHPRGDLLHVMKRSSPGFSDFGEAYLSSILAGEVKGWKRHRKMTLNLVVPVGKVRFVLHDEEYFTEIQLGTDNYARLTVEPGLWMAFQGMSEGLSMLLNIADIEHDPTEAENAPLERFPFNWQSGAQQ
jgi:dTDP-4-dehydrorhamnose 3,5-epimerase